MTNIKIVGDIIPHHQLLASCCIGKNKYDFSNCLKYIEKELKSDFTVCNFESTLSDELSFYGHMNLYMPFRENKEYIYLFRDKINMILINSNMQFLNYICKYFDCLCIANNHTYDGGHKAFSNLINNIEDTYVTGYNNEILIKAINGITIGIYNYTYFTKRIVLYSKYPKMNTFKEIDYKYLKKVRDVCDILIIIPHWGQEYRNDKRLIDHQINYLKQFNPDIIIGSHSHILSDIIYEDNIPIIQSMGNFFAGQIQPNTNIGGICNITIDDNTKKISDINILKTITHNSGEFCKEFCVTPYNL